MTPQLLAGRCKGLHWEAYCACGWQGGLWKWGPVALESSNRFYCRSFSILPRMCHIVIVFGNEGMWTIGFQGSFWWASDYPFVVYQGPSQLCRYGGSTGIERLRPQETPHLSCSGLLGSCGVDVSASFVTIYILVNQHSHGISPFLIGNTSSKGPFSIAMLVSGRVVTSTNNRIERCPSLCLMLVLALLTDHPSHKTTVFRRVNWGKSRPVGKNIVIGKMSN